MPVLVMLNKDYADEFDTEELRVFLTRDLDEVETEIARLCEASKDVEFYFGTNEFLENLHEDSFKVKEVTAEEAEKLIDLLDLKPYSDYCFGTGILSNLFE